MAVGLGVLRLTPEAFWTMTPRELASVIAPKRARPPAPSARDLSEMMRRFPDPRGP
ncbi:phage tail assembly chaperone [Jiella sp. MQZ13P-4]|uniref:Phage tail assembly chaperone n=2 Tax=Jiella sonneratiae TaxID=2816856 RepID=A0ABS3J5G9_9HYPH|nr:rcc01693 family protein [Jiella sonneratiae]MBO0904923.1 phage tail assembly chaperone [Jiella sonneratiae]